jgi:hypothetical protein
MHIVNASMFAGESPAMLAADFEEKSTAINDFVEKSTAINDFAHAGADADTIAEVAEADAHSIEVVVVVVVVDAHSIEVVAAWGSEPGGASGSGACGSADDCACGGSRGEPDDDSKGCGGGGAYD